ncbi:unnamed protein product [Candidula unifasciata]|uniref:PLAT domain-containing protein n=1 Tax=Candidula unifasciata TaxID=100452 RepID=A0A8S3Z4D0_9EUPU|nr:unnamed protein product [Candidula unifasciata]
MSADDLVKSVARKLKYYFEVKRLEDGFDLTDLHQLTLNHTSSKTPPSRKHDALHDRTLKQYFSDPDLRSILRQLNNYDARGVLQGWREIEVRKMLDNYMKHYSFQKRTLPSYYYRHNHRKNPQSAGVILYRRKQNNLLRSWPVKQTLSDQHVSKGEAERLVNSATKIICGSELSSLGKISLSPSQRGKGSASAVTQNEQSRPTTARSGSTLHYKDQDEKKGYKSGSPKTQKRQKYKQPRSRSTSPAQSSRSSPTSSRTSSSYSHSSSSSESSSSHFYQSHSNSQTPKHSPRKNKSTTVINMPGQKQQAQVGIERATQTEGDASNNKKTSESNTDNIQKDDIDKIFCEYQVLVRTGDRLGSGTAAPVKLTLFGDKGRSEEFDLSSLSKRHKIPFQKGNEDLFLLPGCHVGQLRKIQIGHDRAQINYAWFLENVAVYDMHTRRVYQFPCGQWLSGQDGDKKTYRILEADSEQKFTEAPDAGMTKSPYRQKNGSRPDVFSESGHKNNATSSQTKPQDDSQNSSKVISSNVRVESDSARFQESGALQKDDYEQKATKIILRSMPGSKIVDEIILENGTDMDTDRKSGNDSMKNYKSLKSEPDQRKQQKKETERKPSRDGSIHAAVRDGDLDRVKDLLQRSPELKDQRDGNGWTPLHTAASCGNMEVLRWLITSGADVDARTPQDFQAMHVAAMSGHVNIMVILQTRGASIVSCTKEKQSALHLAAKSGHLECVKWLVANDVTLDAEDNSGQTPFKLAETHHHDNCADFLRVCMQELVNPKSTFAQVHARQASGRDIKSDREHTVSRSSQSSDDDDEKGKSSSDSDNNSKKKNSD